MLFTTNVANLFGRRTDGADEHLIFACPFGNNPAAWSPDGQQLAFTCEPFDDIWVINADGTGFRSLTNTSQTEASPAWSPDGTKIAYGLLMPGTPSGCTNCLHWQIYTIKASDGTDPTPLTDVTISNNNPPFLAWSPDGQRISFHDGVGNGYGDDLWVMNADGSGRKQLTNTPDIQEGLSRWSPDGKQLSFVHLIRHAANNLESYIYLVNADGDGSDAHPITTSTKDFGPASWSPNNTSILFTSQRDPSGLGQLYLMNLDGSNPRNISNNAFHETFGEWRPNQGGPTPTPIVAPDPTQNGPITEWTQVEYNLQPTSQDDTDIANPGGYDMEIRAAVWRPKDMTVRDKYPLIVFLHGNHPTCGYIKNGVWIDENSNLPAAASTAWSEYTFHGTCTYHIGNIQFQEIPSYLGFAYLAEKLVSWGYIVVSINVNRGINNTDFSPASSVPTDPLINVRGRMVLKHLEYWYRWNLPITDPKHSDVPPSLGLGTNSLNNRIDFSNVGLMGHSRGGEGVRAAYTAYQTGTTWKDKIPGLQIRFLNIIALINVTLFELRFDRYVDRSSNNFGRLKQQTWQNSQSRLTKT